MASVTSVITLLCLATLWYISSWITAKVYTLLMKYSIFDVPNARSSHASLIPRGGGLAPVFSFIIGCVPVVLLYEFSKNLPLYLFIAIAILAVVSFADDVRQLSVKSRLMAHFAAAILGAVVIRDQGSILNLPEGLELMVIAFAIIGFINLFNFTDGIDGMASSQAIYLSVALGVIYWIEADIKYMWICLALTISVFHFVRYNWHPALMFLGDVGSICIGFTLGVLLLIVASKGYLLQVLILPMYCFGDAGFILIRRMLRLEKVWLPHSSHFFQCAVRNGVSHSEVVMKVIICNALLFLWALASIALQKKILYWNFLLLIPAILISFLTIKSFLYRMTVLDIRANRR